MKPVIQQILSLFKKMNTKVKAQFISCIALSGSTIAFRLALPFVFKLFIDHLSYPESPHLLTWLALTYSFVWLADKLITHLQTFFTYRILEHSIHLLGRQIIFHLLSLSHRFHLDRKTGGLIQHVHQAQNGLENLFWGVITFLFPSIIEMVSVLTIIALFYGFSYSCTLSLVIIAYSLLSWVGMKKMALVQQSHNEKRTLASARMVDTLLNFETVKYFNNEKFEDSQIDLLLSKQEKIGIKRYKTDSVIQLFQSIIIGATLLGVTWFSAQSVYTHKIGLGDFVLINSYLFQFIMPLSQLGYVMFYLRKGLQDIKSINDVLSATSEIKDAPHAISLHLHLPKIIFENLTFGYTPDRIIFQNFNLTIPAGQTIAIVGLTGSGKSTLSRLLFRFYDIQEGSIKIDDYDIRSLSQSSLHQMIGIVPQDPILFNHTLFYNIAYGKPSATLHEVQEAASLAELDTFISSLPQGYATIVGERGLKLSGGEKQRVALARVILKKPSILIFDEATSSLDTQTEREIQNNLEQISKGTTTLIIAHRLSTIIHADQIVVLKDGVIVEQGAHSQLLSQNQLYAQLWEEQLSEFKVF